MEATVACWQSAFVPALTLPPATCEIRAALDHDIYRPADILSYRQTLHTLAVKLCRSPADADDLVQRTVEKALSALPRLHPGSNLRAWLVRILTNCFYDLLREQKRTEPQPPERFADLPYEAPADARPWEQLTAAELLDATEKLPEGLATVFKLHLNGVGHPEIARRLGLNANAVNIRMCRARKQLKELLERRVRKEPA